MPPLHLPSFGVCVQPEGVHASSVQPTLSSQPASEQHAAHPVAQQIC
jgi:hypothetical protein